MLVHFSLPENYVRRRAEENCKFADSVMKTYDPHSCKPSHKMLLQINKVKPALDNL